LRPGSGDRPRPGDRPGGRDRPRRLSTDARRQQILGVALELFADRGFKGTTTRRIADAAGITEACIFQHFADKDALYAAVLAHKADEWPTEPWYTELEALAASGDDEAVVRQVFTRILDRHEHDPHCLRLMVYAALENHALSRRMQGAQGLRLYRFLERFVVAGQHAGRFREGPPAVLARAVLAQPVLYILQRRLFRPAWPGVERREFIETGVSLVLGALRVLPTAEGRRGSRPSEGVA
jgi:AcrR family transcriptional regulator